MRTAIGTRQNIKVLDSYEKQGLKIEVLEYQKLLGLSNPAEASRMYFTEKQNIRPRQIAIYLTQSKVVIEKGAMSYFQGDINMVSGLTIGNAVGKFFKSKVTGEDMVQPEYEGTGLLVLEPTYKHYIVLDLEHNESIIVDDGMFYCAEGTVKVKAKMQRSISSAIAGGEGLFQQEIIGPGLVVLESPVPDDEIDKIQLNNDVLKVDGNFSILRSGSLQFTVERSAKTLVGSAVSGEGLVNVYRGTGDVWLAPTLKLYDIYNTITPTIVKTN